MDSAGNDGQEIIFYQPTAFSYDGRVLPILLHQPGGPEETLNSYRNLCFHTGDLGKKDAEENFYLCGWKKEGYPAQWRNYIFPGN